MKIILGIYSVTLLLAAVVSQDIAAIMTAVASTGLATAYVVYNEYYVRPAKAKELAAIHEAHEHRVDRIRREAQEDTERQLARQYEHFMSINSALQKRLDEKSTDN